MTSTRSVALYARISLDRGDGEGVARQIADCHQLAAERWPEASVAEYVDNDISAFRAKRRPEFDRMLADLNAGQVGAVVAYHPDRLYRRLADLEAFVAGVRASGAQVATVRAGDVDVSTASGQMIAEILASVSKHEAARIGERVSRAKLERATQGRPAGGGLRPFGLTADRTGLVDTEAMAARDAAAALLDGSTWAGEARKLNDLGVLTTAGNRWVARGLQRTMCAPYMAGLRAYKGRVVGDATHPAILDRATWEALATVGRNKPGRAPSERHLLSGVLSCGVCGRPLWVHAGKPGLQYQCIRTVSGQGCGGTSIRMDKADDHVCATVRGWLANPDAMAAYEAWLAGHDDPEVAAELAEIERQELMTTQRWASGRFTDAQHDTALAVLAERRRGIEPGPARPRKLSVAAGQLAGLFDAATVPERRELIRVCAVTPIPVGPGRVDGVIQPAADRIDLRPVWAFRNL